MCEKNEIREIIMQRKEKILLETTRPGVLRYRLSFNGEAPQWRSLCVCLNVQIQTVNFLLFFLRYEKRDFYSNFFLFLPSCHSALPMQHKEKKERNKEKLFPTISLNSTLHTQQMAKKFRLTFHF